MNGYLHNPTMNYSKYLVLAFLAVVMALPAFAQNGRIKRGDKFYEMMAYPAAIRNYEKGLKKTRELRAMERLADSYLQTSNTLDAERWYAQIVKMKGHAPINKFRYGQMLKSNGKYKEARNWFEAYLQTGENPRRAATFIESCDYALEAMKDSARYQIQPLPFNSKGSDFAPVPYRQGMIFTSEQRTGARRLFNMRNDNQFYDIFHMQPSTNKKGYAVKRVKGKVNSKYHDGPAVFSPKLDVLYFTRSYYVKDQKGKNASNKSRLKIMTSTMSSGKWQNLELLPFNSEEYSCGHPTLNAAGDMMVFASDIPGGFGGTDLYMIKRDGKKWGVPKNLGSNVNSEGDETFPYLHPSGSLFFSSDGHPGLGGRDIFAAQPDGEKWGKPENAGYPLNTSADDFALSWIKNRSLGYLSSNRDGDDDIYRFKAKMVIEGTIVDSRTGKPLEGAKVSVLDASSREMKYVSDKEGKFKHYADWGKDYFVTANRDEYLQSREKVATSDVGPLDTKRFTIQLERDLIFTVLGQVTDARDDSPIARATVRIIGRKDKPLRTDDQGKYFSQVLEDTEYNVIISSEGFIPQVFSFSTKGKTDPQDFVFNAQLLPGAYVLVEGKTVLQEVGTAVEGVNVYAVDAENRKEIKATRSRGDGRFWQVLDPKIEQYLIGSKTGYFAGRAELPAPDSTRMDTTISVEIGMVPYEIGATVKIIYYDYNKSDIKKVASKDLMEIVYFLNDNPEASVELSSHTDSRGGDSYNKKLSQRRSDAAVGYIVSRGIEQKRIKAEGYGEKSLVNGCKDGVTCDELQHGQNRRTEIKVTGLDLGKADQKWQNEVQPATGGDASEIVLPSAPQK